MSQERPAHVKSKRHFALPDKNLDTLTSDVRGEPYKGEKSSIGFDRIGVERTVRVLSSARVH